MKRLFILTFLFSTFLLCRLLSAQGPQVEASPRYRLLQVVELSTLQEKINETAAEGYRLVGAAPTAGGTWAAIMEHTEAPSEPYQYLLLARKEDHDFQGLINESATKGFRLLPRYVAQGRAKPAQFDLAWMEKPPGPPVVTQYVLIGFGAKMAFGGTMNPMLWADSNPLHYIRPQINAALEQGYRIERVVPWAFVVMEKPPAGGWAGGAASDPSSRDPMSRYHSLGDYRAGKLQKRLQNEAQAGYHLLDFSPYAPVMWTGALLDRVGTEPSAAVDAKYRYVAFENELPKVEGTLNSHAAQGFRLFPQSMLGSFQTQARANKPPRCRVIMEEREGEHDQYRYRVLAASRLSEMGEGLEKAAADGFRALGIAGYDHGLAVVMEKRTGNLASK
jgi:hypothetical protein